MCGDGSHLAARCQVVVERRRRRKKIRAERESKQEMRPEIALAVNQLVSIAVAQLLCQTQTPLVVAPAPPDLLGQNLSGRAVEFSNPNPLPLGGGSDPARPNPSGRAAESSKLNSPPGGGSGPSSNRPSGPPPSNRATRSSKQTPLVMSPIFPAVNHWANCESICFSPSDTH